MAIFIVLLLAISGVSAQDNATSNVVSVEETNEEVVSVENDDQVILGANNVGTFKDLANEITQSGSVLNLTKNYQYSDRDSSI